MHGNSNSKEDPLRRCDAHPHRTVHIERCSREHQVSNLRLFRRKHLSQM